MVGPVRRRRLAMDGPPPYVEELRDPSEPRESESMRISAEIKALNQVVAEFDRLTAGEFDRETNPKTLLLYAGALSPHGTDLPERLARAFRDVEQAARQ